jgi:two-component system, OmpR family, response regulator PrrA
MTSRRPNQTAESSSPQVLVVDDDTRLLDALTRGLSLNGFEIETAREAGAALACVERGWPDVMVLDIMMPGLDGLALCRLVRERSSVRILMLTALDSVQDRVAGLQMGADDYLVKPFALDELIARLQALLRRPADAAGPADNQLRVGELILDLSSWAVSIAGDSIPVTAKEFKLLKCLVENQGRVLTREDILLAIWGEDATVESNVVDAHIANLRLKLETTGKPRMIHTLRGVGYVLREA